MILFIYGEDNYRSHQKLAQIKAKFIDASLGDTNLAVLDCEDKTLNYDRIVREVLAMPFLAKSRLVVIKNLLLEGRKNLQEKISEFLEKIPQTTVIVFYESGTPDKRTSLFKKLNPSTSLGTGRPPQRCDIQAQEFKLLEPYELKKWIKNEVESQNAKIDNQAIDKLVEYVGNDLWRLSNEISKLISYNLPFDFAQGGQLTTNEVELLVRPIITSNVFDLIDAIGNKNIQKAQKELHKLLGTGENEMYIHTMIVYQFRNLLIIKDLLKNQKSQPEADRPLDEKIKNQNDKVKFKNNFEIAKLSGLHPFVVQKTMAQAQNYTFERLKEIYQILLNYDIKMKTGVLEPRLGLDLLLVEMICQEK